MVNDHWTKKHDTYTKSDWINKPSLFAETAITYFPPNGKVLDLGAGQGQDSRYFAEQGYEVLSTDLEQSALDISREKLPPVLAPKLTLQKLDLREPFPFADESFDAVFAHMALHYFDEPTTRQIFAEIHRVLKPGGVAACLVNAQTDPEYGQGEQLGEDYYRMDGANKRFFTTESLGQFTKNFKTLVLDNQGETYKDRAKGVHNLIRFIGSKN